LDNNDVSDNVRAAQISNAAVAVRASHNMSNYGVSSANGNIKRSASNIAEKQFVVAIITARSGNAEETVHPKRNHQTAGLTKRKVREPI